MAHSTLLDPAGQDGDPTYDQHAGGLPATASGDKDIWVAAAAGNGREIVIWPAEEGDWTIVVMNADGSPGVSADVAVGATVSATNGLIVELVTGGGVLLVVSVAALVLAVRRPKQDTPA